eukprot:Opistho-1_new@8865
MEAQTKWDESARQRFVGQTVTKFSPKGAWLLLTMASGHIYHVFAQNYSAFEADLSVRETSNSLSKGGGEIVSVSSVTSPAVQTSGSDVANAGQELRFHLKNGNVAAYRAHTSQTDMDGDTAYKQATEWSLVKITEADGKTIVSDFGEKPNDRLRGLILVTEYMM